MSKVLRHPPYAAWCLITALYLVWASSAQAHVEQGQAAGFVTGLQHPWSGFDHILAMIAVVDVESVLLGRPEQP